MFTIMPALELGPPSLNAADGQCRRWRLTILISPVKSVTLLGIASMLQAWLYFGMIQLVTALPVATKDYIWLNHRGQRIVTTEKLPEHLERYTQGLRSVSEKGRPGIIAGMDRMLKMWELCFSSCAGKNPPLPAEVVFSMMILFKTLIYAKLSVFPNSNEPAEVWYGTT